MADDRLAEPVNIGLLMSLYKTIGWEKTQVNSGIKGRWDSEYKAEDSVAYWPSLLSTVYDSYSGSNNTDKAPYSIGTDFNINRLKYIGLIIYWSTELFVIGTSLLITNDVPISSYIC